MLSYRHAFHAGNYADVLKHFVLFRILDYITRKPAPIRYVDTHAGTGLYNLGSSESEKLQEHKQGIAQLLTTNLINSALPECIGDFLDLIKQAPANHYPGSPWFAQQCLREQDKLTLCELHPNDFPQLVANMGKDRRIYPVQGDGFSTACSILPALEKRALVLIDPPYEVKDDYDTVVDTVKKLHKKCNVGVYAIWYPIVHGDRAERMVRKFKTSGIKRIQRFEIARTKNASESGMRACGMLVINAPWTLKGDVETLFSVYAPMISDTGAALTVVEDLVLE